MSTVKEWMDNHSKEGLAKLAFNSQATIKRLDQEKRALLFDLGESASRNLDLKLQVEELEKERKKKNEIIKSYHKTNISNYNQIEGLEKDSEALVKELNHQRKINGILMGDTKFVKRNLDRPIIGLEEIKSMKDGFYNGVMTT